VSKTVLAFRLGLRRREDMKELLKFHEKLLKPGREETIDIP
jgi:hypothetical protein